MLVPPAPNADEWLWLSNLNPFDVSRSQRSKPIITLDCYAAMNNLNLRLAP